MRYAVAACLMTIVTEQTEREARDAQLARHLQLAREASPAPSFRRRAGEAVIAFGVRLAGDRQPARAERRIAARA